MRVGLYPDNFFIIAKTTTTMEKRIELEKRGRNPDQVNVTTGFFISSRGIAEIDSAALVSYCSVLY
jgi:hypothetical protein